MDTLILSQGYEPMYRVCWQRAMTMWACGRLEVIEAYEDRLVRGPSTAFQMPSVARMVQGWRRRNRPVRFSRRNVWARDRGRCQYCQRAVELDEATYDHVVPRCRGGRTTWRNVVIACAPCNQRKGDRSPAEAGMRLHSTPQRPRSLPDSGPDLSWQTDMPHAWRVYLGVA